MVNYSYIYISLNSTTGCICLQVNLRLSIVLKHQTWTGNITFYLKERKNKKPSTEQRDASPCTTFALQISAAFLVYINSFQPMESPFITLTDTTENWNSVLTVHSFKRVVCLSSSFFIQGFFFSFYYSLTQISTIKLLKHTWRLSSANPCTCLTDNIDLCTEGQSLLFLRYKIMFQKYSKISSKKHNKVNKRGSKLPPIRGIYLACTCVSLRILISNSAENNYI